MLKILKPVINCWW